MTFRLRTIAFTLPALLLAADASAVRQPEYLDERPIEPASGARGRLNRDTGWTAPAKAARAWSDFTHAHGAWQAVWDLDTGVPLRIWGEGIAAPGANADAAKALVAAKALLAERLGLLAPGATVDDARLAQLIERLAFITKARDADGVRQVLRDLDIGYEVTPARQA